MHRALDDETAVCSHQDFIGLVVGLIGPGSIGDPPRLKALLAPYPAEKKTCWPVSARVDNVKNNDPSPIEPIAANEPA